MHEIVAPTDLIQYVHSNYIKHLAHQPMKLSSDFSPPMGKRKIGIYHRADFDGVLSGAIMKKFIPGVVLIGLDYGDDFDKFIELNKQVFTNSDMFMIDISFPADQTKKLLSIVHEFHIIDHHPTAELMIKEVTHFSKNLKANIYCEGGSAALLAWDWFNNDLPSPHPVVLQHRPAIVEYVSDHDIWKHEMPGTWAVKHGLEEKVRTIFDGSKDPEDPIWQNLLREKRQQLPYDILEEIKTTGKIVESYIKKDYEFHSKECSFPIHNWYRGYSVLAINKQYCGSSIFDTIPNLVDYDFLMCFVRLSSGKWKVSLYKGSKPNEIDLGKICLELGGGGHKNAAGFTSNDLTFLGKP